jgi:alpha-D-ribose 1-methylphosphonate 5-triphosphate synthase subunit PhnH
MSGDLTPGFADPVGGAQLCFRAVLDAMARPGLVRSVGGVSAPAPLCDAAAAVLLTLADHETPLWLDEAASAVRGWIAFHTGAPVAAADEAMFAVGLALPDLSMLQTGSDEMPETSTTVVVQVASVRGGRGFVLDGPGLREPRMLFVDGLPADFSSIWQRNHGLYPRGIDLILCCGDELTALPRSVRVREA